MLSSPHLNHVIDGGAQAPTAAAGAAATGYDRRDRGRDRNARSGARLGERGFTAVEGEGVDQGEIGQEAVDGREGAAAEAGAAAATQSAGAAVIPFADGKDQDTRTRARHALVCSE